jgi:CubicO group peptidase (beta-lactamase class C family)
VKTKKAILTTIFLALTFTSASNASAESPEDVSLQNTLHRLDHELFDAFSKCADSAQLAKHASYFAPDVEFYHDNGGVTWNRTAMLENTKKYACGNYTRELIEDTFKVSPVKDFGAISTGVHRFCQSATKECSGEAEFVMIWRYTNDKWEVTRTLSFGHRPASSEASNSGGVSSASIDKIIKENQVTSVSFALIENGVLNLAVASGQAKAGLAATPATLYNIASLTKPITAEVALLLSGAGEISLDENMSRFWADPDISADPRRNLLTPRIALSHRTGFPNWRNGKLAFERNPGESFGYSGEGYEYLAHFVLNKTKQPIDYWANRLIFSPNGMRNTTYIGQPWLNGRIAFPHDAEGKELPPQISNKPVASDNIFSSPTDYALFISSVIRELDAESSPLSTERTRVQTDRKSEICSNLPEDICPELAGMALGWEEFVIDGVRYFMHTGSDDGTFTFAYFSPDTKSGAVIFTNSSNGSKAVLPILWLTGKDKNFVEFLDALVRAPGA